MKALAVALGIAAAAAPPAAARAADIDALMTRAGQLGDVYELERFHHAYGWQQDYMLFNPQVDLFMDAPGSFTRYKLGYYAGKDGARRVWPGRFGSFTNFADMPVYGSMIDHHQAQAIIDVAPDRQSAKARFRTSADHFFSDFGSRLSSVGQTSGGADQSVIYENEYVREGGVWKLKSVLVCIYAEGAVGSGYADLPVPGRLGVPADAPADYWIAHARTKDDPGHWNDPLPGNPVGPDRVETPQETGCFFAKSWTMIHSGVVPFHFPNPVTGKPVTWVNR